jgi:hypothetical protein
VVCLPYKPGFRAMPESWDGILLEILQFLLLAESVSLGSMNTF